ncbi:50S ribosomal protein L7/L12 [Candidatus Dependentiae bacterium]|nr:50S ribosomal protein L7/L12 [Candidatus Dependentiae bacterium]
MASKSFDKLIQEIGNMSVFELSDLVKQLEDKFDVSAAMSVAAPAGGAAVAGGEQAVAEEEKSEYKVTLEVAGPKKIDNIKALRKVTTLSLTDAKKAVEEAPTVIADAASKDDAQKMKQVLEEVGAKVKLS